MRNALLWKRPKAAEQDALNAKAVVIKGATRMSALL